jgi:hypothetical protein
MNWRVLGSPTCFAVPHSLCTRRIGISTLNAHHTRKMKIKGRVLRIAPERESPRDVLSDKLPQVGYRPVACQRDPAMPVSEIAVYHSAAPRPRRYRLEPKGTSGATARVPRTGSPKNNGSKKNTAMQTASRLNVNCMSYARRQPWTEELKFWWAYHADFGHAGGPLSDNAV